MHVFHIPQRRMQMLNRALKDVKEAFIEWAEGFIGY